LITTPADRREQDREAVAAQLGREPRGRWQVARRCRCGKPQIIETYPRLDDGTPFPTLWWLTCRKLCAAIGQLESSGWMGTLNERLSSDHTLHSALMNSTRAYLERRNRLEPLNSSVHPGGGPDRVKCLHAHTAHQLVTGDNPVGQETLGALGWTDPEIPCI
jgi:uncharacterized protein